MQMYACKCVCAKATVRTANTHLHLSQPWVGCCDTLWRHRQIWFAPANNPNAANKKRLRRRKRNYCATATTTNQNNEVKLICYCRRCSCQFNTCFLLFKFVSLCWLLNALRQSLLLWRARAKGSTNCCQHRDSTLKEACGLAKLAAAAYVASFADSGVYNLFAASASVPQLFNC